VHHYALQAIEGQVGAQLRDVARQAFKGVHMGGSGVAGYQQAVDANIGADVGTEIAGPQIATQKLHRGPVRSAVVEAGLALLAAAQQPDAQPIDPGNYPPLDREEAQLLLQLVAPPATTAPHAADKGPETAGGAVGGVGPDLAQAVGDEMRHEGIEQCAGVQQPAAAQRAGQAERRSVWLNSSPLNSRASSRHLTKA
jgi:hypothetical protein